MNNMIEYYEKYNILQIPTIIESKIDFIKELLNYNYNNHKLDKYYKLYEFIINFIITNKIDTSINSYIVSSNIIKYITMIDKGHILLKIFNDNLQNIIFNNAFEYILISAGYGSLPTFIFWMNFANYKNINEIDYNNQQIIIRKSIYNQDDRLYEYILKNMIDIISNNVEFIKGILISICNIKIKKYIIQKLKILNKYIDLNLYINYIILHIDDFTIIHKLNKHYNIIYDFQLLNNIIAKRNYNITLYNLNNHNLINNNNMSIYNLLNTIEQQTMLNILCCLKNYSIININNIKINVSKKS